MNQLEHNLLPRDTSGIHHSVHFERSSPATRQSHDRGSKSHDHLRNRDVVKGTTLNNYSLCSKPTQTNVTLTANTRSPSSSSYLESKPYHDPTCNHLTPSPYRSNPRSLFGPVSFEDPKPHPSSTDMTSWPVINGLKVTSSQQPKVVTRKTAAGHVETKISHHKPEPVVDNGLPLSDGKINSTCVNNLHIHKQ